MLEARDYRCYIDSFGRRRCYNSRWHSWGRWVVLGLVIAGALFFMLCLCCLSRRRARRGRRPFYGTGWAMGNQPQQNYQYGGPPQNGYYGNQQQQPQQPAYNAPPQYAYHQGGYAETGVTPPKPAYNGDQYAPPTGPPPNQTRY